MHETEQLSELIGAIYDAAIDANLWVSVLGRTREFVGGAAAGLGWKDAAAKSGGIYYDDYHDDGSGSAVSLSYRQSYFEKYVKLDPCSTGQFFAEIGQPVITTDLIPYDEFLQTRFYKEWVRPQGLIDACMTLLDRSTTLPPRGTDRQGPR